MDPDALMLGHETIALLAGALALSQLLATLVGKLVDRIGRNTDQLSPTDRNFMREQILTLVDGLRGNEEQNRAIWNAIRESAASRNKHLENIEALVRALERRL